MTMIALTINNNFLKLASLECQLFKKIPLGSSIVDDCEITNQEDFVVLVEKSLAEVELPEREIVVGLNEEKTYLLEGASVGDLSGLAPYEPDQLYIIQNPKTPQIAAVEKALVDGYAQALEGLGFRVEGFVPLALSLAGLTKEKETPHLIVCLEDDELVFVLVKEGGVVPFSATYPAEHILESTTAVLEFVKAKYQTTDIKKLYVCGEKSDQVVKTLKEAKLLVEDLKVGPPEFCKLISLLQFNDPDLTIRPGESPAPKRKMPHLPTLNLPPLTLPLTLAVLLVAGVVFGGLVFFRRTTSTPVKPLAPTVVPEATPAAEEALPTGRQATTSGGPIVIKETEPPVVAEHALPEKFDKSVYKIQILNGRGTQGAAANGQAKLEELGYTVTEIDNTAWSLYSIIKVKEGSEALLEALTADLESEYEFGDSEILEKDSPFDAVLIIGSH